MHEVAHAVGRFIVARAINMGLVENLFCCMLGCVSDLCILDFAYCYDGPFQASYIHRFCAQMSRDGEQAEYSACFATV